MVAIGIAYLLIKAGWIVVNTEGTFLLLVLVFGAGTDYSLLLVHRYREELAARDGPPPQALPTALRETMPAIAASGGTVIAAMLVLLVADLQSTHWLGPILAIGIAVMVCSRLHPPPRPARGARRARLLARPRQRGATLSAMGPRDLGAGRRAGPTALAADHRSRHRRPPRPRLGNLSHHGTIGFGQGETKPTNSSEGTEVLNEHFPPGLDSPLTAVVAADEAARWSRGMENARLGRTGAPGPADRRLRHRRSSVLILAGNPYSGEAAEAVEEIRERLHAISPTACSAASRPRTGTSSRPTRRDTRLIVPLVLLVVGADPGGGAAGAGRAALPDRYRGPLLRRHARALHLRLLAALGSEGIAFDLTLLAFLFLVALGVDYNIFLMTRVREEARVHGTREGVMVALVATGGVVTGAGLILAGTFATLTLLPLEELIQIGATVAIGVLLDTFVVRALLIPAITYRLGERAWWPARARRATPARPVPPSRPPPRLVAGARLHFLALARVRAALLLQRLAGVVRCRRRGGRSGRGSASA